MGVWFELAKEKHLFRMSRYPSAHGHTPSYRSVGSMPAYPSALGTRDSDLSFRTGLSSDIDREFSSLKSSMRTDSLLSDPVLKYDPLAKQASATSYKSSTFSETSSSSNGGVPHRTSHHDSTQRTTRTGDSG